MKKFQLGFGLIIGLIIGLIAIPAYIWFQFASSDSCRSYGSCLSHGSELRSIFHYAPVAIIAVIIWRGWLAGKKLNAMRDEDQKD